MTSSALKISRYCWLIQQSGRKMTTRRSIRFQVKVTIPPMMTRTPDTYQQLVMTAKLLLVSLANFLEDGQLVHEVGPGLRSFFIWRTCSNTA